MHRLLARLEGFDSPRVALVGDFMLDRWVYGNTERLSQEAPVPILLKVREKTLTGGAGNVAQAVMALGAKVTCIGVIGQDPDGVEMARLLASSGAETSHLIKLKERTTTVKTRYVGLAQHRIAQQMFRVDSEDTAPVSDRAMVSLKAAVRSQIASCQILALEDYNKGIFDNLHTPEMIAAARQAGRAVVVDPALISDYRRYRGATLLTPNRFEAQLASGVTITDDESLERAARQILLTAEADAVAITLDKEGIYLLPRQGEGRLIPSRKPRSVYDVSGAGDEVMAMLAVALAGQCPLEEAVALANIAGGLEVEQFGVVPISKQEIGDELRRLIGIRGSKLIDRDALKKEVDRRRRLGQSIVFTNGCFDLLHAGHIYYLREAREQGACLIVAINSDESVKRLKGPSRPIVGEKERGEMLAALECVDYVTIFEEDTTHDLLDLLRPDMFVKGGSTDVVVERDIVEGYGGRVVTLGLIDGLSTTKIIDRILNAHNGN